MNESPPRWVSLQQCLDIVQNVVAVPNWPKRRPLQPLAPLLTLLSPLAAVPRRPTTIANFIVIAATIVSISFRVLIHFLMIMILVLILIMIITCQNPNYAS
ncbi:hypothetical protein PanWU01x14_130280 [Parasponia andersonii]|uniref:Transmembrane protein n=1 Tax=Parasponia andersonii TaxID=3476 RepID=A0A2P5CR79_PARAD|nr:hypothetical protein PanWU01x14_130280 [Parasponia andersonii]